MSLHEIRLSDYHETLLDPVTRYFNIDPTLYIEAALKEACAEYRARQLTRDGADFSRELIVESDYDPGYINAENVHVVELPNPVSLFFAREIGNVLPVDSRAFDTRISLLTEAVLLEQIRAIPIE